MSDIPEPPPLGLAGMAVWEQLWSNCHWLRPRLDAVPMRRLCETYDERAQLRHLLNQDPERWRERVALRAVERSIDHQEAALGIGPAARRQLQLEEVRPSGVLAELRRSRAERERSTG